MHITIVSAVSDEIVEALHRLVPQLSSSSPPPSKDDVIELVNSPSSTLLIARDDAGAIIGTLTLIIFRIPTGVRAWIEDVIVDESARRRGVGEALNRAALDLARAAGVKTVDLTSRPARDTANRLYLRMGFELRNTNVYRFELS